MRTCNTVIEWEDGTLTTCCQEVLHERYFQCYNHRKYFNKVLLGDGKYHWQSGPCYLDRKKVTNGGMANQPNYIVAVHIPEMTRVIGDEYSE